MTTSELEAIEARVNAATAGEWRARSNSHGGMTLLRGEALPGTTSRHPQSHLQIVPEEDAAFIAAARSDVTALIAEVKRLKELAKLAYQEGWYDGHSGKGDWHTTNVYHALEGE